SGHCKAFQKFPVIKLSLGPGFHFFHPRAFLGACPFLSLLLFLSCQRTELLPFFPGPRSFFLSFFLYPESVIVKGKSQAEFLRAIRKPPSCQHIVKFLCRKLLLPQDPEAPLPYRISSGRESRYLFSF